MMNYFMLPHAVGRRTSLNFSHESGMSMSVINDRKKGLQSPAKEVSLFRCLPLLI